VLAAVGVGLLIAAGIIAFIKLGGPGTQPSAQATPLPAEPGSSAGPLAAASSASSAASASSASARPSAPQPTGSTGTGTHADPLGTAAASYVSARSGVVLAAVYDLRTGRTWRLGQGQPQDEASIVKLDVLETLLAERGHSGTALSASDQALAQQMIEDSDNDAATSLWDMAGGATGIGAYNAQAGLTHTTPSACIVCSGFPWPGWGLTTTAPEDQITLLRRLVETGGTLTSTGRDYALSLMENVAADQQWGVSGGVPSGVTVALKNGWLPLDAANSDWQINSVGWVHGGGRDYLLAMLSTGNPSEQYGISTLNALGAMVWKAL